MSNEIVVLLALAILLVVAVLFMLGLIVGLLFVAPWFYRFKSLKRRWQRLDDRLVFMVNDLHHDDPIGEYTGVIAKDVRDLIEQL